MATITLDVSDEDLQALEQSPERFPRELLLAAALHWWAQGRVSLGWAAKFAGISYRDFMNEISTRKITWPYDQADLEQDLKSLSSE